MVLAQGVERDIADHDQLVVLLFVRECRWFEFLRRQQLAVRARDSARRVAQTRAGDVLAERDEEILDRALGSGVIDFAGLTGLVACEVQSPRLGCRDRFHGRLAPARAGFLPPDRSTRRAPT